MGASVYFIKMVNNMNNNKKVFLAIVTAFVSTSAISFEYVTGIDNSYNASPLLLGAQNPTGTVEFVEFTNNAIAFEGYSEPNFGGTKTEINANNTYEYSPHEMKSYKIVETKNASHQTPSVLYVDFTSPLCANASYAVPSKEIAEKSIGEFCYVSPENPVAVLDFPILQTELAGTDEVEIFLRGQDNKLISAFNLTLGKDHLVKINPTSFIADSAYSLDYKTNNVVYLSDFSF
jgi:hypothetical protein